MNSESVKVGVAIYAQHDLHRRPRAPHWVLAIHPTSYSADDVRIYHIRGRSGAWTLSHDIRILAGLGDLLGVLHVADMPVASIRESGTSESESELGDNIALQKLGMDMLDAFIKQFPATKNGDDPGQLFVWTCESYVIRALAHLSDKGALELPCRPSEMYEYTKRRINALKSLKTSEDTTQITVIPYRE